MSEHNPEEFAGYGRKCLMIFAVVMCVTLMMVGVYAAHLSTPVSIALILGAACVNAALVACSLMHVLTEKKMTYITFAFTAVFFIGLMALTLSARLSVPHGTIH